jgi:hypothetical protein
MATASQGARPSPERIFSTLVAYQQTEALKAAIELDIFTKIGEGANEVRSLARAAGASERGVRILCDYMTIFGFLTKDSHRYALTQESAIFLDRRSPAYMGAMANFLASDMHRESFGALADAVRKGGSATTHGDNTKPRDDFWDRRCGRKAGEGAGHRGGARDVWNYDCPQESGGADCGAGLAGGAERSPGKREEIWRRRSLQHAAGKRVRCRFRAGL